MRWSTTKTLALFVAIVTNLGILSANIDSLEQSIRKNLDGETMIAAFIEQSNIQLEEGNIKNARHFAVLAKTESEEEGDQLSLANAMDCIGLTFEQRKDYKNALEQYLSALKIKESLGKEVERSNFLIGNVFLQQSELDKAQQQLEKALEVYRNSNDNKVLAEVHKKLGDVYFQKQIYGTALQHYQSAKDLKLESGDYNGAAAIAQLLGQWEYGNGSYEDAFLYFEQSLEINQSNENAAAIAADLNSLGLTLNAQEDYIGALEYLEGAFDLSQEMGLDLLNGDASKNIAEALIGLEDAENGLKYLDMSAEAATKAGDVKGAPELLLTISNIFKENGQFEKAHRFLAQSTRVKDAVFSKEKMAALLDMQTKYESEFEATELKSQNERLVIKQASNQKMRYFLFAIIGLILAVLGVLYNSFKRKQKDNALLHNKNEEINAKNEEINDKNKTLDLLNGKLVDEIAEREAIEQSSFARDRFLATMSHEMRTPMNIISGLTHLLLSDNPRPDQVEHLRTLQFSANNLVVFINDVLDFSKIEAGKLSFEQIDFKPINIFEEIRERFSLPAQDKGLKLSFLYEEMLPSVLSGDATRLNQVVTNLITNAIKYTDEGDINVKVGVDQKTDKELTLEIIVSDTGKGIEAEQLETMFRKFTRSADDIYEGYGGSGLGLAIAKRLVDLQNGRIEASSTVGEGSTFHVYLPYKLSDSKTVADDTKPKSYDHLAGKEILLVEDNKINQLVVAKMLRRLGMTVVTANNGKDALDEMDAQYFDLVLMDIQMPVMDGYRATAEIRKSTDPKKRDVPIIALTASAYLSEKDKARLFGMNDHVGKPFGPEDLLGKIDASLNKGKGKSKEKEFVQ